MRQLMYVLVAALASACGPTGSNSTGENAPRQIIPVVEQNERKLNVLIIADVLDHGSPPGGPTIAAGVRANEAKMTDFLRSAANQTGLKLDHPDIFEGAGEGANDYTCNNFRSRIATLKSKISPDDVVVFYYTGHGYNRATPVSPPGLNPLLNDYLPPPLESNMPYLFCKGYHPGDLNLRDIARTLSESKPRFVLVISDSCNSYLNGPAPPRAAAAAIPAQVDQRMLGLFSQSSGTVLIAGTKPGFYGFYAQDGGYFTNQLMNLYNDNPYDVPLKWETLGSQFYTMRIPSTDGHQYDQTPIMERYETLLSGGSRVVERKN